MCGIPHVALYSNIFNCVICVYKPTEALNQIYEVVIYWNLHAPLFIFALTNYPSVLLHHKILTSLHCVPSENSLRYISTKHSTPSGTQDIPYIHHVRPIILLGIMRTGPLWWTRFAMVNHSHTSYTVGHPASKWCIFWGKWFHGSFI